MWVIAVPGGPASVTIVPPPAGHVGPNTGPGGPVVPVLLAVLPVELVEVGVPLVPVDAPEPVVPVALAVPLGPPLVVPATLDAAATPLDDVAFEPALEL
jgi:hypothetical protein